jgi:hypothetical protein
MIEPPKGYEIVTTGKLRRGDLAHSDQNEWNRPTKVDFDILGKEVGAYYCIARPIKPVTKPKARKN